MPSPRATKVVPRFNKLDWRNSILRVVSKYPKGFRFTPDKVRIDAHKKGIPPPQNPAMWGSVLLEACRDGLAVKTGRYTPSIIPSNHRRITAEWEKI